MEDVRRKYVPPAIDQVAFNCPHCGALAKQSWFSVHVEALKKDETPPRCAPELAKQFEEIDDLETREQLKRWAEQMIAGRPFIHRGKISCEEIMYNVSVSRCFSCNDISIWINDRLVWPSGGEADLPNPDLPNDVLDDYEEASIIFHLSPRGAATLLRLGIQKLCKHLGEKGDNVNADIAALVKKDLDRRVLQALDVVRVIGNNAVHPGQIDLRDDRATAEKLFALVNLIAEIMISQPKHVGAMFDSLPEDARKGIERRDGGRGTSQ